MKSGTYFYIFFIFILIKNRRVIKIALTKSKEFEIRMRYELGEDLSKLAVIYKVPLSTLKKRKKLAEVKGDAWVKGIRSKIAYETFVERDEQSKRELRQMISEKAREEADVLQELIDNTYKKPGAKLLDDKVEKAVKVRAERIEKMLQLRRNIEEMPTVREEYELKKIKLENELKKIEVETKKLELEELKEFSK